MSAEAIKAQLDQFRADFIRLRGEIAKVIVGQDEIVDGMLTGLFAGGHVLLEGRAGPGQDAAGPHAGRGAAPEVQAHPVHARPDAGRPHRHQRRHRDARRRPAVRVPAGPVFANIVLADEINRATPKTQSALLEAMQEQSGHGRRARRTSCREPFFVLATQNPLEQEGTYPLPEAQLDRFLFKLLVKFPTFDEMETILDRTTEADEPKAEPVVRRRADPRAVAAGRGRSRSPTRSGATRSRWSWRRTPSTSWPTDDDQAVTSATASSPRGAQAIILAAKIRAILDHRYHVAREDIRAVAPCRAAAPADPQLRGPGRERPADDIIDDVLEIGREPAVAV